MKKLQLLLLEDNKEEANEIATLLNTNGYIVSLAKNTFEADREIKNQLFDIMILDIMINGKPDGISFAQKVHLKGIYIPFLFLTSVQSKSIFDKAKYTNPFNYLLKPYNELELLYALELAIETHYHQSNSISLKANNAVLCPEFLFVKKNRSVVKIDVASINHIEVDEKYCSLVCDNGNYLVKLSLTKIKSVLSNPDFKQVHRNYLINIKKIKEIYFEDNLIILNSNNKIPFSERFKASFRRDNPIFN